MEILDIITYLLKYWFKKIIFYIIKNNKCKIELIVTFKNMYYFQQTYLKYLIVRRMNIVINFELLFRFFFAFISTDFIVK